MTSPVEYHSYVRRFFPASVGLFSLMILPAVFLASGHAQMNSTTGAVMPATGAVSPRTGGVAPPVGQLVSPPTGVPALSPRGIAPNSRGVFLAPNMPRNGEHRHHHPHDADLAPGLVYPVPYAVDAGATQDNDNEDPNENEDDEYLGGPTIFDRRGSGANSYVPPVKDLSPPPARRGDDAAAETPQPPPQPTVLVFKDGRKLEVGNYAILGQTIFDLTPGHARKIALADLDLEATRQQNDDRGVTFQLPASAQAN
jgi:hypothetical protein